MERFFNQTVMLLLVMAFSANATPMRGVWVPVNQARTVDDMTTVVKDLVRHNVTDIFVDGLNNGVAYFPSATHRSIGGQDSQGPDLLGAALQAAQGRAKVHAWLEYGLIAQYGSKPTRPFAINASANGWILGADSSGFLWMDGRLAGVQAWLCGIIADASVAHPELESVQLDDHFALPASLVGHGLSHTADMTKLAESLSTCSKSSVKLSLSPATLSFAKADLNVDWALWLSSPVSVPFSVYYPQIYRSSFDAFEAEYNYTVTKVGTPGKRWVPGIRVLGSGAPTPWNDVELMLNRTKHEGGVVAWYAAGITNTYSDEFCDAWGCNTPSSNVSSPLDGCDGCRACVASGGGTNCLSKCAPCSKHCADCINYAGGRACAPRCSDCVACVQRDGGKPCLSSCSSISKKCSDCILNLGGAACYDRCYMPAPAPAPGPSAPWPTIASQAEYNTSPWKTYFKLVYGEDPSFQFPLDLNIFWVFHTHKLTQAGASHKVTPKSFGVPGSAGRCPPKGCHKGQRYDENNMYSPTSWTWVWHPPPYTSMGANSWAEVVHMKDPFGDEKYGAWFLYAKGSGVWFKIGKTIVLGEHSDGYKHFGAGGNEDMCQKAAAQNFDSIQFTSHVDHTNYPCDSKVGAAYMNLEIVAVKLVGTYPCGTAAGAPSSIRAGWKASRACKCDSSQAYSNCAVASNQQVFSSVV